MNGCPHNDEFECFNCADIRHREEHPVYVEGCRSCKLQTIQISPAALTVRREMKKEGSLSNPAPQRSETANNWEKGIARDHRGVPFLGKGGMPIGVKEYSERRSEIETYRRRLRSDPNPLT